MLVMLFFYYAEGCGACHAAQAPLAEFHRKHPRLFVVKRNVTRKDWQQKGVEIKATPTYTLTVNGRLLRQHVGSMTEQELEAFTAVES